MEKRKDIFISQTKGKSCKAAKVLQAWLRDDMKLGEPWLSDDIPPGERWRDELDEALEKARFGIVCITTDNLTNAWIVHEAGILGRNKGKVCPYFIDLDLGPEHLPDPLRYVQAKWADQKGTEALVRAANSALGRRLPLITLKTAFNRTWEGLEVSLEGIRNPLPTVAEYEELIADFIQLFMDINEYRESLHFSPIVDEAMELFEEKDYKREKFVRYVYEMIDKRRERFNRDSKHIGNVRDFFKERFTEDHLREKIKKLEPILRSTYPPSTKRDLLLKHVKAEELKVYLLLYQALVDKLRDQIKSLSAFQPHSDNPSDPTP